MKAKIKMKNTPDNQEVARQIRDANRDASNDVEITFSKDLTDLFFEGELIWIPNKNWFSIDMLVDGQVKKKDDGVEIQPQDKGKTVNLRLDAKLVAELNEVRNHVMNKTQHDLVLELFKKGLDQYNKKET